MAKMVTGSVAERVDPKMRHSRRVNFNPSRPRKDQMYTSTLELPKEFNKMAHNSGIAC